MQDNINPPSKWSLGLTKLGPVKVFLGAVAEKWLPIGRDGMTGKERVIKAIEFKGPDRIPHQKRDYWFLFHIPPQSWQPPEGYYPYVHPGVIKTRVWKWDKRKDIKWLEDKREAIDEFGTIWKTSGITSLGETIKCPLEDGWELLDEYKLPDMKNWDRFKLSASYSKKLGGDRYRIGVDGNSIWERFRFLRGFENAMMDLALHPDKVHRLMGMLTDMTIDIVDNFSKAGIDGFMLVDDWGTQVQSFISPRHFEEFFFPCYKRIADRCHELDMHCGLHSCGDLKPLVPLMIESGLDFLELDSPDMCGVDWLADNAAGKVNLWCSVDIQNVYPTNDPKKIERYVKDLIMKLGDHNGGLVAWPYSEPWVIDVGHKAEKLERELFEKYGDYPLDLAALK
jgi:hypothetical protein